MLVTTFSTKQPSSPRENPARKLRAWGKQRAVYKTDWGVLLTSLADLAISAKAGIDILNGGVEGRPKLLKEVKRSTLRCGAMRCARMLRTRRQLGWN